MPRVFVLTTGRTGSTTFIRACEQIWNYSAGHETLSTKVGDGRFDYPDDHIEADNRLSWFLGSVEERFGPDPFYVHLTRGREDVARSFLRRWRLDEASLADGNATRRSDGPVAVSDPPPTRFRGIIDAFAHSILMRGEDWGEEARLEACRFYVDSVTANIRHFLRDKPRQMTLHLETLEDEFAVFWDWIGAEGNYAAATAELGTRHNASVVGA